MTSVSLHHQLHKNYRHANTTMITMDHKWGISKGKVNKSITHRISLWKSCPGWDSHQWHSAVTTKPWSLTEVFREFFKAVLRCMKIREGCELGEAWRKVCHFVLCDVQDYQVAQPDNTLENRDEWGGQQFNEYISIRLLWHSCPDRFKKYVKFRWQCT